MVCTVGLSRCCDVFCDVQVHGVNQFVEVGRALAVKSTQMSEVRRCCMPLTRVNIWSHVWCAGNVQFTARVHVFVVDGTSSPHSGVFRFRPPLSFEISCTMITQFNYSTVHSSYICPFCSTHAVFFQQTIRCC